MYNVYLIQPNYDWGPGGSTQYYLPYSIGIIWSYAYQFEEIKNNFQLKEIIFKRENVDTVLERIENPAILAFSCYMWNWEYNKILSKRVKEKFPNCKIVFGGPSVTDRPFEKLFFQNHRYVDCIINGEGEYAFKDVLDSYLRGIPLKKVYTQTRIDDLDLIPSPYLTGVFDNIIKNNPDIIWQFILETNRGCPFSCTFCDWGTTTYGKVKKFDLARVKAEVQMAADLKCEYIYISDANYGIFKERDKEIAQVIQEIKKSTGYPQIIAATWNKNLTKDILDIVKILGSRGMTVALQSLDEKVLKEIKRTNMEINNLSEVLTLCSQQKVPIYSEFILGLPYETKETWRNGHFKLMGYGHHDMLDIYLNIMIENSELNSIEQIEKHSLDMISVDDYTSGDSNIGANGIQEKTVILRGTKYMPFDDLIESYMFSWGILTFHSFGYTQIYSRYLNNKSLVTYQEFYERFFDYVQNSSGLLNTEFQRIRSIITNYLTTGKLSLSSDNKFDAGHNIMHKSLTIMVNNNIDIKNEIINFVNKNFKHCLTEEVYADLVKFQDHFTVDLIKSYPLKLTIDQDLYYTIFENISDKPHKPIQLLIESVLDLKNVNLKELSEKLYITRRINSSKVRITVID